MKKFSASLPIKKMQIKMTYIMESGIEVPQKTKNSWAYILRNVHQDTIETIIKGLNLI
jgi:hypothetical protein